MSAAKNIQNAIVFTAYCCIFCKFAKFAWRVVRYFGDVHNNVAKKAQKKTGGVLPSVLGIEYTLSKTVLGKSAVISENQTATSDGERGM